MNEIENDSSRIGAESKHSAGGVQLSNGMVVSLGMAKQMGLLPPDATPGT